MDVKEKSCNFSDHNYEEKQIFCAALQNMLHIQTVTLTVFNDNLLLHKVVSCNRKCLATQNLLRIRNKRVPIYYLQISTKRQLHTKIFGNIKFQNIQVSFKLS